MEYLNIYKNKIDFHRLSSIKEKRSKWINRKTAQKYRHILENISEFETMIPCTYELKSSRITVGKKSEISNSARQELEDILISLIPWRKGPFNLFGIDLDAEWRSDFKWNRIKDKIKLKNKIVLDIGCNNGYYLFQMLEEKPKLILGIDPFLHYYVQFSVLNHFISSPLIHYEMFGVEHLECFKNFFDTVFSMGIIYHHRDPLKQLVDIRESLKKGGELILETLGINQEGSWALTPSSRYAKMSNIWFVPTLECLINWLKRSKFVDIEVLSTSVITSKEQRTTKWCPRPWETLKDFIDPNDHTKTIEGHPAPLRFCLRALKKQ